MKGEKATKEFSEDGYLPLYREEARELELPSSLGPKRKKLSPFIALKKDQYGRVELGVGVESEGKVENFRGHYFIKADGSYLPMSLTEPYRALLMVSSAMENGVDPSSVLQDCFGAAHNPGDGYQRSVEAKLVPGAASYERTRAAKRAFENAMSAELPNELLTQAQAIAANYQLNITA